MDTALCTLSLVLACEIDDFSIGKFEDVHRRPEVYSKGLWAEYKIKNVRPTAKYKLYQFSRVNKEFEKRGFVVCKQLVVKKNKRTESRKEEVERLFAEHPFLRKLTQNSRWYVGSKPFSFLKISIPGGIFFQDPNCR